MTIDLIHQKLPMTGDFNSAALASARRLDVDQIVSDDPILGLTREAGYLWGTLRDEDGVLYSIMRRIDTKPPENIDGPKKSLGGKLILVSNAGGDQLQLERAPRFAADSASITRSRKGDAAVFEVAAEGDQRAMSLSLSEKFAYVEDGVIDVTGTLAATPLQWYLPGPKSALLYLTQTWLVEGELLGKKASGFLFWEEAFMPEGGRLYVDKDPLADAEYFTWYSWANQWEDGSMEVGHFLYGQKDFHVGVTSDSEGRVRSARSMDCVVRRAEDGYWHDGIDYEMDGVRWVCDADPQGRMQGLGKMPNPQQEGFIHRVDDSRVPKVWMAWGESVPAAGEARRN